MKCYELAPVGNPVSSTRSSASYEEIFPGQAFFVNSGTAALALALSAIVKQLSAKKSHNTHPEVLLPAYACPDLVSAVLYAGAKPVLIDLQADTPWMDLTRVTEAISAETVALIAVNFLGIAERLSALKKITEAYDIFLIEDNAQAMTINVDVNSAQKHDGGKTMIGDIAIMSFGRGKPFSILGGGVVYSQNAILCDTLSLLLAPLPVMPFNKWAYQLKVLAYNALLNPYIYWIPANLPFLHLGETRFSELLTVMRLDAERIEIFVENYKRIQSGIYDKTWVISDALQLTSPKNFIDLPALTGEKNPRLLRYPILLPSKDIRDRVFKKAKEKRLGVSVMYGKPLSDFEFFSELHTQQKASTDLVATNFANRLITLPTHYRVNKRIATSLVDLIASEAG